MCRSFSLLFAVALSSGLSQAAEAPVLARVDLPRPMTELPVPAYAHLRDDAGQDYVLSIAPESILAAAGLPYRVLSAAARPEEFVLVGPWYRRADPVALRRFNVLYDDGRQQLLRADGRDVEALAALGLEPLGLCTVPMVWGGRRPESAGGPRAADSFAFTSNALAAEIVGAVRQTNLVAFLRRLTGAEPAVVGGGFYTIVTRHTTSGTPIRKAVAFVSDHLSALGLQIRNEGWTGGGYAGTNVIATQPGGALSNEIVVVVAHLDDRPEGAVAPGADDNASGSVAVLTAADILSRYRFDRTIRYTLVTGEEQGLHGSYYNAQQAHNTGDNIVAVFNMDMLGWNGAGGPVMRLHTRLVSNPAGYSNDLAIAAVFTNVVATYGLGTNLTPVVTPDGISASDHKSYWDRGYPAILAIEDYPTDWTPYYHTTNDTLASLNLSYYTAFVRASLGTVAHLAGPAEKSRFDVIEIANGDWQPTNGIGVGVLTVAHETGATESGTDPHDLAWSNAPANPNPRWLKIHTAPDGMELRRDARPSDSETIFRGSLSVSDSTGAGVSATNGLRFTFLTPPETGRVYTARIHVDGAWTPSSDDFDCVTNLLDVASAAGWGYVTLPGLVGATSGTVYGTCDIAVRDVNTAPSNTVLRVLDVSGPEITFATTGQAGTRLIHAVEVSTNLLDEGGGWTAWVALTNGIPPAPTNFESGWDGLTWTLDLDALTNASPLFFRFQRGWLDP